MKVCISVNGCFWAIKLAYQLQQRGYLQRLITTYPKFYTRRYHLKNKFVKTFFLLEILKRSWQKLPYKIRNRFSLDPFSAILHDYYASFFIPKDCAIFVAWSGSALRSLKKAKKYGAITILERGSTHILFQQKILTEEYKHFELPYQNIVHPAIVNKELLEYEIADYICLPSSFVKQTFLDYGIPEKKLLVIPFGVDLTHFYPKKKIDNIFRIIFCGGHGIRKGLPYLLQAFYELDLPYAELCIIGNLSSIPLSFLQKFKHKNIKCLGSLAETELNNYYAQGSVFCLHSIEEGLAMVLLQAMACGLPVICSTNTGGADLIQNGKEGFVIPTRDLNILKEKILFCYHHQDICKNMGQQARSTIEKNFTWSNYGNKIVTTYRQLLQKRLDSLTVLSCTR